MHRYARNIPGGESFYSYNDSMYWFELYFVQAKMRVGYMGREQSDDMVTAAAYIQHETI